MDIEKRYHELDLTPVDRNFSNQYDIYIVPKNNELKYKSRSGLTNEPKINWLALILGSFLLSFLLSYIATSLEYSHRERMEIYRRH